MRYFFIIFIIMALLILGKCALFEMEEEEEIPHDSIGFLEIEFVLPEYDVPKDKIHQVDLSIAYNYNSAVDGKFLHKANVSDQKSIYRFTLLEGEYYFRAGISCACSGDSCIEQGFSGGQYDIKYIFQPAEVKGGKNLRYSTNFE